MTYRIVLSEQAEYDLTSMSPEQRAKAEAALARLAQDPRHPDLDSHRCESVFGPDRKEVWQSCVVPAEPDGAQLWWWHGPGEREVTVLAIAPYEA